MKIFVTAIKPSNATHTAHITGVRWLVADSETTNTMTTEQTIDLIRKGHNLVVAGPERGVSVHVVNSNPPYLRTAADDTPADNLLALPRY